MKVLKVMIMDAYLMEALELFTKFKVILQIRMEKKLTIKDMLKKYLKIKILIQKMEKKKKIKK